MVYITGDCHADWKRFSTDRFPEQKEMTRDDIVIVCGDFGLWHDTPEERYWLKWLGGKPFTTVFVDGNHRDYVDSVTQNISERVDRTDEKIRDITDQISCLMQVVDYLNWEVNKLREVTE